MNRDFSEKADLERPYNYASTFWDEYGKYFPDAVKGLLAPAQLEIHPPFAPGRKRCWLQCPHCYGDGEQTPTDAEKMDEDTAVRVIKEIKGRVPRIVISGTYSDPLFSAMTPALLRAARESPTQKIGLHTKLLELNPDVEEALLAGCQDDDYLAISLDAGTPRTYDLVHGINGGWQTTRKPSAVLGTVKHNLLGICARIRDEHLPLRVNLTYLLTDMNANEADIKNAIALAIEAGADVIRFSIPQPQTLAPADRIMVSVETVEKAQKVILSQSEMWNGQKPAILLREFHDWKAAGFRKCYSQLFHPAIGGDGYLYPCCQVATKDFTHLRMGNLRHYTFWELWYGEARQKLIEMEVGKRGCNEKGMMNCRVCNRKDGAINRMLGEKIEVE